MRSGLATLVSMDDASTPEPALFSEARPVLEDLTGVEGATFHEGQFEAISALVE